jgi:peptide deformylase
MQVVLFPDQGLQATCDRVDDFGPELKIQLEKMAETMYASRGVGLAAPQVGINQRLIVVDPSAGEQACEMIFMVNPVIVWSSKEVEFGPEGCLSIPGVAVNVARSTEIEIEYQDVSGQTQHAFLNGFLARIVQHEVDHLNGVLMLDRASPMERRMAHKNLSKKAMG